MMLLSPANSSLLALAWSHEDMIAARIASSAALAVLVSALVSGCASAPTIDHVEAKAELESLIEIAQDAIGGEWETSDTGAQNCALGGGAQGASYGLSRFGQAVVIDAQDAIVDQIVAEWAQQGVDVVVTTKPEVNDVVVTQIRSPEGGVGPGGFYVEVWISDRASNVGGRTRCAAGDAAEINSPGLN